MQRQASLHGFSRRKAITREGVLALVLNMEASENICEEQVSAFRCWLLVRKHYFSMKMVNFC